MTINSSGTIYAVGFGAIALSVVFGVRQVHAVERPSSMSNVLLAQNPQLPSLNNSPILPPDSLPPATAPFPETLPEPLPAPEDLLRPGPETRPATEPPRADEAASVYVRQFRVVGSTIPEFSPDQLAIIAAQAALSNQPIPELLAGYCAPSPSGTAVTRADPADRTVNGCCPEQLRAVVSIEQREGGEGAPATATEALLIEDDLSFEQLLRARSAITQLYINCGYITSGAILPEQIPADNNHVVTIQVVEGQLEAIAVTGTRRLNPEYIRDRLAIAGAAPVNQARLIRGLQLLQLDRELIQRISADLQVGTRPGTNILQVAVVENSDTTHVDLRFDNNRSPSVGSVQRGISLRQVNPLGLGDRFRVDYTNTDGSNQVEASYRVPINPRNGSVQLRYSRTRSNVIEDPFDLLDIAALSASYEATVRQPLYQTPNEEFALGLTASLQESQTEVGFDDIGSFPLSPGADEEGRTRVTALRFTQEWTHQGPRQVLAARSQFSLGVDWFDANVSDDAPDSRFLAWRGLGQWVRLLAQDMVLLVRTDVQITGNPLVPLEQFGLGGQNSVRGYRQDALLTDNGALFSAELRVPIVRVPEWKGLLQIVPFIDAGTGWNVESNDPDPQTLVGTGIGLLWQQGENLSIRLDWGIPLVDNNARDRTWQENGLYFSVVYTPF